MQILINKGKRVDRSGNYIAHEGKIDFGVKGNYHPIPLNLLEEVVKDIKFPLEWLDMPLFLFPYRLMLRDKNGWTGAEYNGRAYASHIIYGARKEIPTKESIGALIVHELGHALMYIAMNTTYGAHMQNKQFKEYMKLRKIPEDFSEYTIWEKRPAEVFAEDFRYLFGSGYMKQEEFMHYKHIDPPGEKIKEFMLSLIGGEELNNPNKIILHHSATDEGTFESIKRYHIEKRGFNDIGYHYLIETDGSLHEGRKEHVTGAHTIGENETSIGICLVGNFDKYKPNTKQFDALNELLHDIFSRYGKLPIYGHNKYANKTCPGTKFPMKEVIEMVDKSNLNDIKGHWAEEDIKLVIEEGKMKGYPDGTFKPNQSVTRAELATVLANQIRKEK